MNYFLLFVIVGVCGGSYYMYTTDQEQITSLQQQVKDLSAQVKLGTGTAAATASTSATPAPTPVTPGVTPVTPVMPVTPVSPVSPSPVTTVTPSTSGTPLPAAPLPVVAQPSHMNAIDAAANAAVAAANGSSIGTITTLNHKTYTNCKVLKVEQDGVTFSHDDGITKILYPMMQPDLQKQFGYSPQGAVAQTEAQIRAQQQSAAAPNGATATP